MKPVEQREMLEALSPLAQPIPVDEEGPVFAEPWEAQAFAMTVHLHAKGVFKWNEWADTFGAVIAEDTGSGGCKTYYELWLDALERITRISGLMSQEEYGAEKLAWKRAVEATPHGEPIVLMRQVSKSGSAARG